MKHTNFNENWLFDKKIITLPHDGMINSVRDGNNPSASGGAYFAGGTYIYEKEFEAEEEQRYILEFEGIYLSGDIYLNDELLYHHSIKNIGFEVDLTDKVKKGTNRLKVVVDNNDQPNARWYTGSGIIKPVIMHTGNKTVCIKNNGIRIKTPLVEQDVASVVLNTHVVNHGSETGKYRLLTIITDEENKEVTREDTPVTLFANKNQTVFQKLYIRHPKLWNVLDSHLYKASLTLYQDTMPISSVTNYLTRKATGDDGLIKLDEDCATFGIRNITVDPVHGLRINGKEVLLKGACIHEDNGILGNIDLYEAELYKVTKLKEAGFNAIRIAHQPAKKSLLKVCDELGMMLMEESFDSWSDKKTKYDTSENFKDYYLTVIANLVNKDYNHPCVIMYCIGNEIQMLDKDEGISYSKNMTDLIRALDDSRIITNAINAGMLVGSDRIALLKDMGLLTPDVLDQVARKENATFEEFVAAVKNAMASGDINTLMTLLTGKMNAVLVHPVIFSKYEEICSHLDVCGYNYMLYNYENDTKDHPNRIIFGSETNPPKIEELFDYARKDSANLGDFTWTGYDYLGETGVGVTNYDGIPSFSTPYPGITAYCGDLDLIGYRRPLSYLREIVFGGRNNPYISLELPQYFANKKANTPWCVNESIRSYTFNGFEGKPIACVVYTKGSEVELSLNGKVIERKKPEHNQVRFEFDYAPGQLKAIAYDDGKVIGEDNLCTCTGAVSIEAKVNQYNDYYFIELQSADSQGTLYMDEEYTANVICDEKVQLLALGSGNPSVEDVRFNDFSHTSYRGRLLLIVKKNGNGSEKIEIKSDRYPSVIVMI